MVAVNRVADLAIRPPVAHQPLHCRNRLCGTSYRSCKSKDYGLILWYDFNQRGFQAVDEPWGLPVEPQAKFGCADPLSDLTLYYGCLCHRQLQTQRPSTH